MSGQGKTTMDGIGERYMHLKSGRGVGPDIECYADYIRLPFSHYLREMSVTINGESERGRR